MVREAPISQTYLVRFDTNKFSQRQLRFLGKVANGFLSPLHNQCVKNGQMMKSHYEAVLQYQQPLTNKECRESLAVIRYPILSIRSVVDLRTGTIRACHIMGKQGSGSQYDHNQLQWFGSKKKKPDERYWFYYHIYTKFGLKKYRGWTDKCLRSLPKPTDEKQNPYYSGQSSPAWNQFVIEDLEKTEPIKSILVKKKSPEYQKKRQDIKKKAQKTRKENIINAGVAYGKALRDYVEQHADSLSDEQIKLAMVLQKLTVLNHIAKTLADSRNWGSKAWLSKKLWEKYNTDAIYDLKNKVEQVLMHYFNDVTMIRGYVPEDADKIWVDFCDDHNQERFLSGYGPLDFFYSDPLEFIDCPRCYISVSNMYYACYNFDVKLNNDLVFNYHCPYPVGKRYFGPILKMDRVDQMPNEASPFLFGHESSMDENEYAVSHDLMKDVKSWVDQFDLSKFNQYSVNEPSQYKEWVKELRVAQAKVKAQQKRKRAEHDRMGQLATSYNSKHPEFRERFVNQIVDVLIKQNISANNNQIKQLINRERDEYVTENILINSADDKLLVKGLKRSLAPKRVRKLVNRRLKTLKVANS